MLNPISPLLHSPPKQRYRLHTHKTSLLYYQYLLAFLLSFGAMSTAIIGECRDMCPVNERVMREREGLLHKFERSDIPPTSAMSVMSLGTRNRAKSKMFIRRGDPRRVVKVFARSAAGQDKTTLADLRPPDVLEETVQYLFDKILTRPDESFLVIYDFIFDRLRAVRQDLVIQRIVDLPAIKILESITRFHVYSAYRCRHELLSSFDPHTNRKHLIDNLKRLLHLYELNSYWNPTRVEFESLYVILCPGSGEVLRRALVLKSIPEISRDHAHYQVATQMCLAFQFNNFVKYFKNVQKLPPLLCAAAVEHVAKLRRYAFQVLSKAYGSSTCKFPLTTLASILLYPNVHDVEQDLSLLGVQIVNREFAVFSRSFIFSVNAHISCDLRPLCSQSIFEPSQVPLISRLICPELPELDHETISAVKASRQILTKDWFSD